MASAQLQGTLVCKHREAAICDNPARTMAESQKKVLVRMEDQSVHAGYLPASVVANRMLEEIELLDTTGRLLPIPMRTIRYIAYVRDFNLDDGIMPERLTRKTFLGRPRTEGLWVKLTFLDGDQVEGLAALDLTLIEDAISSSGIYLLPPDARGNTQRLFVPRSSMARFEVVSVVTTPSKARSATRITKKHEQELNLPFPEV